MLKLRNFHTIFSGNANAANMTDIEIRGELEWQLKWIVDFFSAILTFSQISSFQLLKNVLRRNPR